MQNITEIEGKIRAIGDSVLVSDMFFGDQVTKAGIIIRNDDGSTRGIYPRWARIYDKGPRNKEEYQIGDWVLIEHGRWTRGVKYQDPNNNAIELRMIDSSAIMLFSNQKPSDVYIGSEYTHGDSYTPNDFSNMDYE